MTEAETVARLFCRKLGLNPDDSLEEGFLRWKAFLPEAEEICDALATARREAEERAFERTERVIKALAVVMKREVWDPRDDAMNTAQLEYGEYLQQRARTPEREQGEGAGNADSR